MVWESIGVFFIVYLLLCIFIALFLPKDKGPIAAGLVAAPFVFFICVLFLDLILSFAISLIPIIIGVAFES